ncbi:hypothetical protein PQX77_001292 [Marasmius sp. AFHP31]|nr:hypothetical protein PQX77_001292 [Marasmius sp. AFHP31]
MSGASPKHLMVTKSALHIHPPIYKSDYRISRDPLSSKKLDTQAFNHSAHTTMPSYELPAKIVDTSHRESFIVVILDILIITRSFKKGRRQAGMMKLVLCIYLFALLVHSCRGLNFTIPDSVDQGTKAAFNWNASKSEFTTATTNASFVALLIKPPPGYHCPQSNIITQLKALLKNDSMQSVQSVIEDWSITSQLNRQSELVSGSVLLRPEHSGDHFVCAYKNVTGALSDRQDNLDLEMVENLTLMNESSVFPVNQKGGGDKKGDPTSNSPPPPPPTSGGDNNPSTPERNDVALILGGIAGGIAVISTLAAVFFYRRFRYQRKLNQFHREHQLLNQTPPTSFLASTMTMRSPNHGATSPPAGGLRSPGSPNASLGFDGKMEKNDRASSLGSPRSTYSASLQHVPVLRAQHGPGLGASNV